ncbi:helix-turn-helix domain-containing protein [uncultured Draconibacterium sp.]|uniref:helix-turn-helix domain-containing protein n=1 Tax=uncultured Draconibacterium sp. TaxID=1573823 RepID=UPI0025DB72B5|nr:helix-turn-helix domain-containing protein [uncultured Draconibacterium sp.]
MSLEELVKKNTPGVGANVQLFVTPESLNDFARSVAAMTATEMIQGLKINEKPLSEKEACEKYNKTRQSFSKYRKQGKIRYHRLGREILYYDSELREDLANF